MSRAKATVARHTGGPEVEECPATNPNVERQLRACRDSARDLAREMNAFLAPYHDDAKARWLTRAVDQSRVIFQPWVMEILFSLAITREARFGEMQRSLGVSSRTLSDKLQTLRDEGLVERTVYDEQPVRIEYKLTREGRVVAALATPLFAELNRQRT